MLKMDLIKLYEEYEKSKIDGKMSFYMYCRLRQEELKLNILSSMNYELQNLNSNILKLNTK